MKKQGFFVKFVSLVAFQLRGPGPQWATPLATSMILRQDRALKFFQKKKNIYSKIEITFFSKRGGLESSHLTVF